MIFSLLFSDFRLNSMDGVTVNGAIESGFIHLMLATHTPPGPGAPTTSDKSKKLEQAIFKGWHKTIKPYHLAGKSYSDLQKLGLIRPSQHSGKCTAAFFGFYKEYVESMKGKDNSGKTAYGSWCIPWAELPHILWENFPNAFLYNYLGEGINSYHIFVVIEREHRKVILNYK